MKKFIAWVVPGLFVVIVVFAVVTLLLLSPEAQKDNTYKVTDFYTHQAVMYTNCQVMDTGLEPASTGILLKCEGMEVLAEKVEEQ